MLRKADLRLEPLPEMLIVTGTCRVPRIAKPCQMPSIVWAERAWGACVRDKVLKDSTRKLANTQPIAIAALGISPTGLPTSPMSGSRARFKQMQSSSTRQKKFLIGSGTAGGSSTLHWRCCPLHVLVDLRHRAYRRTGCRSPPLRRTSSHWHSMSRRQANGIWVEDGLLCAKRGIVVAWTFHVVASGQRRLLARILQVLENQQVAIYSFSGMVEDDGWFVTATVESPEDDRRYCIAALLYGLEDVHTMSVSEASN